MSFQYILIPADKAAHVITKEGSTAGGLNDDFLLKSAKEYFAKQSGPAASTTAGKFIKSVQALV